MSHHRKSSSHQKKIFHLSQEKIFGAVLFLLGIFLILSPGIFSRIQAQKVSKLPSQPIRPDETLSQSLTDNPPIRIIIPSAAIDLPVKVSHLISGVWELSDDTASFGEGSSSPDEPGNTVIFAHARPGLFLPLKEVKLKDYIYVMTKASWHQYEVSDIREVSPSDTYVVRQTMEKRVTLFTCSGFFDSKRLVVVAKAI